MTNIRIRKPALIQHTLALSVLILSATCREEAFAQLPAGPHEVLTAVRNSKVWPEGTDVRASISGRSVVVTTYQDASVSDKNCKIDAAVIAKSITDSFPDLIVVRFLYYDKRNPYSYRCVDVQKSLIDQFGKGKIADTVMIDALPLVSGRVSAQRKQQDTNSLDNYTPAPGMALEERSANLMYIRKLKRLGGNADPFFQRFMTIEKEFIGRGKFEGFAGAMNSLNADLVNAIGNADKMQQQSTSPYEQGPKQGELYDRRKAVYARLEQLSREGKNVNEMKRMFQESVESKVGRPNANADIEQTLTYIENRLRHIR